MPALFRMGNLAYRKRGEEQYCPQGARIGRSSQSMGTSRHVTAMRNLVGIGHFRERPARQIRVHA